LSDVEDDNFRRNRPLGKVNSTALNNKLHCCRQRFVQVSSRYICS
jgi:hypothetical protein